MNLQEIQKLFFTQACIAKNLRQRSHSNFAMIGDGNPCRRLNSAKNNVTTLLP